MELFAKNSILIDIGSENEFNRFRPLKLKKERKKKIAGTHEKNVIRRFNPPWC
jgi:hypothetical protein